MICRKLKERRKKVQEDNKKVKEQLKEEHKVKSLKGMKKDTETDVQMKQLARQTEVVDDDDKEYYKEEVGEDPDAGKCRCLFF